MEKNLILDLNTVPTKLDLMLWIKYKFEFPDNFTLDWAGVDENLRKSVKSGDIINIQYTGRIQIDMRGEIYNLHKAMEIYNRTGLGKIQINNNPY